MKPAEEIARDVLHSAGPDVVMLGPLGLLPYVAQAITAARREGAEEMREEAALVVLRRGGIMSWPLSGVIADSIRALPVGEEG